MLAALLSLSFPGASDTSADQIFQVIRNNDLAALKRQLADGADVNSRDRKGVTPLLYAAAFGSTEAVKLVLDSDADVNAKNAFDATA